MSTTHLPSSTPTSLAALQDALRGGQTFSYRLFYGHTPRADGKMSNAVFSQFFARPFVLDGVTCAWAEQWMMASKARLFGDNDSVGRILAATSPQDCKQLGRAVRNYDDALWANARIDIVTRANIAKFGQHDDLKAYLLATGDEILVEATRNDRIWGNGLDRDHPDAMNPLRWPGQNLLGFALVRARAVLRGDLPAPEAKDTP